VSWGAVRLVVMTRIPAILLVGPTGSGKTPLGDYLELRGLWGRRCVHFDFGAQLRAIAEGRRIAAELTEEQIAVVVRSLGTGALLENEHFAIAAGILRSFADQRRIAADDRMVLNGLARHIGQARDVDQIVAVSAVVSLECSAEVVYERIRLDSGGDRAGRTDDDLAAVARKLKLFAQRTVPLLEHYRSLRTPVHGVKVSVATGPEDIWTDLSRRLQSESPS